MRHFAGAYRWGGYDRTYRQKYVGRYDICCKTVRKVKITIYVAYCLRRKAPQGLITLLGL